MLSQQYFKIVYAEIREDKGARKKNTGKERKKQHELKALRSILTLNECDFWVIVSYVTQYSGKQPSFTNDLRFNPSMHMKHIKFIFR